MSNVFEHVENLQRGDALSVGRNFPHVVAAITGADRLDPIGLVVVEIAERELPAVGLRKFHDLLGDFALVKSLGPVAAQYLINAGQVGVLEDVAEAKRLALGQEGLRQRRVFLRVDRPVRRAITGASGNPSRAAAMVGDSSLASARVCQTSSSSISQPLTQPGTLHDSGPRLGSYLSPSDLAFSSVQS